MKGPKTGKLTCIDCGKAATFRITSPAAPTLSMCEEAGKVGWSYSIGFFTMLTGDHQTRCPRCTLKVNERCNDQESDRS